METPTFLTEPEVAERLRCSTTKVKRLRLSGKLSYIPGRPVLIDEADLQSYIDEVKVLKDAKAAQLVKKTGSRGHPDPRIWAAQQILIPRIRRGQ